MESPEDIDLELHESFDRKWRVGEYLVISLLSLLSAAALTGALGSGPVSHASLPVQSAGVERIEYERIVRNHGSDWLRIYLAQGISGRVDVHLDRAILRSASVESVSPQPLAYRAEGDGVTYTFDARAVDGASLDFKMSPYRFGVVRTTLTAAGARAALTQIILP
jgi:hypothetical protein